MKSYTSNGILALLLIFNGLIVVFQLADEDPMGTCAHMASLIEPLAKISSYCKYSDSIIFTLGIAYILIGILCYFTSSVNWLAILLSIDSILVFDNPLFSKPEYCKSSTILFHILVIGIAFTEDHYH